MGTVGLAILFALVVAELVAACWCARVSPLAFDRPGASRRWYVWLVVLLAWVLPLICMAALVEAARHVAVGDGPAASGSLLGALSVGALFVIVVLAANALDRAVSART